eukprot:jgi/Mesvir1/6846/Mv09020-RA.1
MATEVRFRKGGPADAKEEPEGARSTQQRRRVTTQLLGLLILASLVMTAIFVKVHYHFTLVHYAHFGRGGELGSRPDGLLGDAPGTRRMDGNGIQCRSPWCEKAADLSGALEQMVAASEPLPVEAEIKPSPAHEDMLRLMQSGQPDFAGMVHVVQEVVEDGLSAMRSDPDKDHAAAPPPPVPSTSSHGAEEDEGGGLAELEEGEGAGSDAGADAWAAAKSVTEAGDKPRGTFESIIHLLGETTSQFDSLTKIEDEEGAPVGGQGTVAVLGPAEGGAGSVAGGAATVAVPLEGAKDAGTSTGAGAQEGATISDDDFMKKLEQAGKALDQHLRVEDDAALSEADLAQLEALVQELERAEKERLGGVHQLLINRMRALDEQPRCMGQPPEWTKIAMGVPGGASSLDDVKPATAVKKHSPARRRQLLAAPYGVSPSLSAPAGAAHLAAGTHRHGDGLPSATLAGAGAAAAAAAAAAGAGLHGHSRAVATPGGAVPAVSSLSGSKVSASLLAELADLTEESASPGGSHGAVTKGAGAGASPGGEKHAHGSHHHGGEASTGGSGAHASGSTGVHAVLPPPGMAAQELASAFAVDPRTALEKSKKVHLITGLGKATTPVGGGQAATSSSGQGAAASGQHGHLPHGAMTAHHPAATPSATTGAHAVPPHPHEHGASAGHHVGGPASGDVATRHEGKSAPPGTLSAGGGVKHHMEGVGGHAIVGHVGPQAQGAGGLSGHGHTMAGALAAHRATVHPTGAAGHGAATGAAGHPFGGAMSAHVAALLAHKPSPHGAIPVHGVGHHGASLHGPHGGHAGAARAPSLPHRVHPPPGAPAAPVAMKSGEMTVIGLDDHHVVIETEHGPRPERVHYHKRRVGGNRGPLVECLHDLSKCGRKARHAAHRVPGMQDVVLGQPRLSSKLFKSCAIVGNGGGLMRHPYGDYIDQHEVIVRVNILPMQKYRKHIGQRTNYRVLSYKVSLELVYGFAPFWTKTKNETLVIWFPANRADVAARMHSRLPTFEVVELGDDSLESIANVFKSLESELYKLQMGPFSDWEFMSSGMHAVLAFLRVCNAVNLYGFTLDMNSRAPYWFTGRLKPPTSAVKYISQDLEAMVLRLLYAAGFVNVCSM